jgi:ribosome modulation factor
MDIILWLLLSVVVNMVLIYSVYREIREKRHIIKTLQFYTGTTRYNDQRCYLSNFIRYSFHQNVKDTFFNMGYNAFSQGKSWKDAPYAKENKATRKCKLMWIKGWRYARDKFNFEVLNFLDVMPINHLIEGRVREKVNRKLSNALDEIANVSYTLEEMQYSVKTLVKDLDHTYDICDSVYKKLDHAASEEKDNPL